MHIAIEASGTTATRFLSALRKRLDRVLTFPESGSPREQLARDLRAAFHGSYVIYYRTTETSLIVVRVLHGARDHAAIAQHGGFG